MVVKFISPIIHRLPRPKSRWAWIALSTLIPAAVLAVFLAGVLSEAFRDWLLAGESGSTTIRNLGLVLAGLIALPLAIWRGLVAQIQADAAQQSLRNERYQKGAEMLGHERLSVRLGGIGTLQSLAEEYAEEYHVQIIRLFSAFARHPTSDLEYDQEIGAGNFPPLTREDVQTVIWAIGGREARRISLENKSKFQMDLSSARLSRMWLPDVNLSNAICLRTNFFGSNLVGADLSDTKFALAFLENVALGDANLSGALFTGVKGLAQSQLDQARADPKNPPKLENVTDPQTGQPLVWTGGRGTPLKDDS